MADDIRALVAALPQGERESAVKTGLRPRCPKTRQGDGERCRRPIGHPGDCTRLYASQNWDHGFGPDENMRDYPFDMSLLEQVGESDG